MKEKFKLTALERNWILYDIANSAFTLLVSTLIPIYFNSLAGAAGVHEDMYLSYWGYAGSISTVLVAIIAPICGTLSDRNFKKPIFLLTVLLGCVACACMGLTTHWLLFLGIFIIAKVGFHGSLVFFKRGRVNTSHHTAVISNEMIMAVVASTPKLSPKSTKARQATKGITEPI